MKWRPFTHSGQLYDLSHLSSFEMDVVVSAKASKPEQRYPLLVDFSLHCFTEETKPGDDPALAYADNRETRTFNFDRYQLSHHLPGIVQEIGTKHCMHTGQGNFFLVELVDEAGDRVEYEIYFDVKKGSHVPGRMQLFIQSAYVRDAGGRAYRPKGKKIRFSVIAYNRRHGKPIKTPR